MELCTIDHYQSFVSTLNPLQSFEIHFKPNLIDIHMLNSSNDVWVNVLYKTTITTPCSICVDREPLQLVKGEQVIVELDGNKLKFKTGKLTHSAPQLADPSITRKNKDDIEIKWPHITIDLTASDVKDILSIINNKSKYDFILQNNTFTIRDATNNDVEFNTPTNLEGEFTSRFHGVNLIDCILSAKHVEGCQIILGTESPIEFIYHCEWMDVTYLIAPMIEKS
jgi:hypothetical protein